MATEQKSTEETKKMTVKEIISSRLKAREERDKGIMQFYDELVKESLQEVEDSVFKRGENTIDLILITDNQKNEQIVSFINEKVLFCEEAYQNPSQGFDAFKKMFEGEDGLKGVGNLESETCKKLTGTHNDETLSGFRYSFRI